MSSGSDEGGHGVHADGTQEPDPPVSFPDPLAGLGNDGWQGSGGRRGGNDVPDIEIAQPVGPNPDLVREMVHAATGDTGTLDEEAADGGEFADPDGSPDVDRESLSSAADPDTDADFGQPNRTPLLLGLHQQNRSQTDKSVPEALSERSQASRFQRPSSGAAGLIVAVTLCVVFVILAIQLISSFVTSITGIFD